MSKFRVWIRVFRKRHDVIREIVENTKEKHRKQKKTNEIENICTGNRLKSNKRPNCTDVVYRIASGKHYWSINNDDRGAWAVKIEVNPTR